MKKIALKRLTRSDLTFFIWHFHNGNAGHQKAINLNADVFVEKLFPRIQDEARRQGDRFSIDLNIFGPSGASALNLQRKIVKGDTYKNWRLNGEFVRDEEERFRPLQEGDLAVIEFEGEVAPTAARLVLIASAAREDAEVHAELDAWLGRRRMAQIHSNELETIVAAANVPDSHPLTGLNIQNELEDAAQGGLDATRRLLKRSKLRRVSHTELKAARNQADQIGAIGEEFVNEWLSEQLKLGCIANFEWVSRQNAIAPYDFTITTTQGQTVYVDVKSTSGPFHNPFHMSCNELLHSSEAATPYLIYRVFSIDGPNAQMRISEPIESMAKGIWPTIEMLPDGITVDSISIDPRKLQFESEIDLVLTSDSSDE